MPAWIKRIGVAVFTSAVAKALLMYANQLGYQVEQWIVDVFVAASFGLTPAVITWLLTGLLGLGGLFAFDWYQYRGWIPFWPHPNVKWLDDCQIGKTKTDNIIHITIVAREGICKARSGIAKISGTVRFEKSNKVIPLSSEVNGVLFPTQSIIGVHPSQKFKLAAWICSDADGKFHPSVEEFTTSWGNMMVVINCDGTEYRCSVPADRIIKETQQSFGWDSP